MSIGRATVAPSGESICSSEEAIDPLRFVRECEQEPGLSVLHVANKEHMS